MGRKDIRLANGFVEGQDLPVRTELSPLFWWLNDHPMLYAASTSRINCVDCEEVEFRFRLKSGASVVVKSGMGFEGDDFWALSSIVDAVVGREISRRNK